MNGVPSQSIGMEQVDEPPGFLCGVEGKESRLTYGVRLAAAAGGKLAGNKSRFQVRREDRGDTRYLYISGELDMPDVSRLLDSIEGWEDLERLVIDATDLTFLDSGGLATLVAIRSAVGSDAFELIAGQATRRLVDLTGTGAYLGVDAGSSDR